MEWREWERVGRSGRGGEGKGGSGGEGSGGEAFGACVMAFFLFCVLIPLFFWVSCRVPLARSKGSL